MVMVSRGNITTWPSIGQYEKALETNWRTITPKEPEIQYGELLTDKTGPLNLNGGAGKYVCVYKVGPWAVRCFTDQPPKDISIRYQEISKYLDQYSTKLSFLTTPIWVNDGIYVDGLGWFPFVKVRYIESNTPLGVFLKDNCTDSQLVTSLAKQLLHMTRELEEAQIAHGDLDITNVLVHGSRPNLSLCLIDFDSMYVPSLNGYPLTEDGHEHFQPGKPDIRRFNVEMDRFSTLVIYISLIALASDHTLWKRCHDVDSEHRLLLGADDFESLQSSHNFKMLRTIKHNQGLQDCLTELELSIRELRMPKSLTKLVDQRGGMHIAEPPPIPVKLIAAYHVPQPPPLPVKVLLPSSTSNVPIVPPPKPIAQPTPSSQQGIQPRPTSSYQRSNPVPPKTSNIPISPWMRVILIIAVISLVTIVLVTIIAQSQQNNNQKQPFRNTSPYVEKSIYNISIIYTSYSSNNILFLKAGLEHGS